MAIGWLTVLKSVPWEEVISNAPRVAEGAKKLWQTVSRKPPSPGTAPPLESQLAHLRAAVNELHDQMQASSELIKTLAEQNAGLIRRIELNRVRLRWLSAALGVVSVVAVWALIAVLVR
jgi:hypothetical protein